MIIWTETVSRYHAANWSKTDGRKRKSYDLFASLRQRRYSSVYNLLYLILLHVKWRVVICFVLIRGLFCLKHDFFWQRKQLVLLVKPWLKFKPEDYLHVGMTLSNYFGFINVSGWFSFRFYVVIIDPNIYHITLWRIEKNQIVRVDGVKVGVTLAFRLENVQTIEQLLVKKMFEL